MHIRKNIKTQADHRRGSIAVESAILLPLVVIGILTVGYLIKFCMVSEGVHHALADESHRIAAEAAISPYPVSFQSDIERRAIYEGRGDIKNVEVSKFLYRTPGISKGGEAYSDLIGVSVSFDTSIKLPKLFLSEIAGERTILCRAFVGLANGGAAMPFSEMERDDDGGMVWVFPRFGERYHEENCSYIKNYPQEILLDSSVRRQYSPCSLCDPGACRDGTLVYCFPTSGKAYHVGECTIVDRYVIEIAKIDAEQQGYTKCSKC